MTTHKNAFIFQSIPERFDLREKLQAGKADTWYATRYRNDMTAGDLVFFWLGGEEQFRGIYGWGRLTSDPYMKPAWDSHGVDIVYSVRFKEPILVHKLRHHPKLRNLLILRAPQATNFLITSDEVDALKVLIGAAGERAP